MESIGSDLSKQLAELTSRVQRLELRLAALEGRAEAVPAASPPIAEVPAAAAAAAPTAFLGSTLGLVGRSLLVLAGAFVLRSLTEAGTLPQVLGAALGIAYGIAWLVFADRAAGKGAGLSATFHGLVSAIIVFPLLAEATTRFKFLPPVASAAALLGVAGIGLFVAWRRDLPYLAWLVTIGATATALILAFGTREIALFAGVLLLIALAAFWSGSRRGWTGPGWFAVIVLDGLLLLMVAATLMAPPEQAAALIQPSVLVGLLLALTVLSFAAFVTRTWRTGREVSPAEMLQGTAACLIGFGGALAVTHRAGTAATVTGIVGLLLAAAAYAASFTFIDRLAGRRLSFMFYTTAALVLTLLSAVSLWHGSTLAIVISLVGLATAWIGSTRKRETLSLHAMICILGAAVAAGLGPLAFSALTGPQPPPPGSLTFALVVVLVVAAIFCWLPVPTHGRTWGALGRSAKVIVMVVLLAGLDVIVVALVSPALPRQPDGVAISAGALAALRTALISLSAILLPVLAERFPQVQEAAWLVYPLLVLGGVKLLFEDLRSGSTAALVLSFALYGAALILAPRLARRVVTESTTSPPS